MRSFLVAALAGLFLVACGGDDIADPFADSPDGSGGRPNDASADRRDGSGGSGVGGAGGRATGGSAGSATGGTGGGATGGAAGSSPGDAQIADSSGAGGAAGTGGTAGSSGAAGSGGAAGTAGGGAGSGGAGGVDAGADGGSGVDAGSRDVSPDASSDATADVSLGNDASADVTDGAPRGDEPQCSLANQCPAPANGCLVATCVDGGCGSAPVSAGTPVASQVAGNCKRTVCDGAGGTQEQNDDADLPNDSNACTTDGCNAGSPTYVALTGQTCGTNGVCSAAGQCVGCNGPADCPGFNDFCKTKTCASGTCGWSYTGAGVPLPDGQQTAGDCKRRLCTADGNVTTEAFPSDLPVDQNACTQDVCTGPTASNPVEEAGFACGGGHVCDGAGACVECNTPAHCSAPAGSPCVVATCNDHLCGTANAGPNTACGAAASCGLGTQHLADQCGGGQCVPGADSACSPYACGATSCKTSCDAPADCAGAFSCDTGTHLCVPPNCITYCDIIQPACTGTNQQYPTRVECLRTCANAPANLLQCHIDHAGYARDIDPVSHCPHAGPGGDSVCGANCDNFCAIAASACPGESFAGGCATACTGFADYTFPYKTTSGTGNTFACRLYHLTLASVDPVGHCPHIRVDSAVCVNP